MGAEARDRDVVDHFGREWERFDQAPLDDHDLERLFDAYFAGFPWDELPSGARGVDVGCGTGRWARLVARRVDAVVCVDASTRATAVARRALAAHPHVDVVAGSALALPVPDACLDFGYALGVLHHLSDPAAALRECVRPLRPGAPFLVYLYYALDGRPGWYRALWRASEATRRGVSRLPFRLRSWIGQAVAVAVYWPLARVARGVERWGASPATVELIPLAFYRDQPLYTMRNDAVDRFGTPVARRYTRAQVRDVMAGAGLVDIAVSDHPPYWCAVGRVSGTPTT